MSKTVHSKRRNCTKSEFAYIKGIIHNLSFQRWTAQEIVNYLRDEKKIEISRSTVSRIKNQVERKAEKWYIELRQSRYKYIAIYKERIDSLLSYQKKLHQIIDFYMQPPNQMLYTDTVIRAISELHKIELSIFNLWKQLPNLDIVDQSKSESSPDIDNPPIFDIEDVNGLEKPPEIESATWADLEDYIQCSHSCDRWFREPVIRYHESKCPDIERPMLIDHYDEVGYHIKPSGINSVGESEDDKEYFQCDWCRHWWRTEDLLKYHKKKSDCHSHTKVSAV